MRNILVRAAVALLPALLPALLLVATAAAQPQSVDAAAAHFRDVIRAEADRLEAVGARHDELRETLAGYRQMHARAKERLERFLAGDARADYQRVRAEHMRVLGLAVDAMLDVWQPPHAVPRPRRRLAEEVRLLPEQYAPRIEQLRARQSALNRAADQLDRELAQVLRERAALYFEQARTLARLRADEFARLGPEQRAALVSMGTATADSVVAESTHAALALVHGLRLRRAQLRDAPDLLGNWPLIWTVLWWLIELPIVLLLLRFMLRRWDAWMNSVVEVAGTSVHLGGWALLIARLAEFAKSFGPALLVLLAAAFVYRQLGGRAAPTEIQVIYIVVFWMAAFRFQLRLVERVARHLGTRVLERHAEHADEFADDLAADPGAEPGAGKDKDEAADIAEPLPEPTWEMFARTWRVLTGYAAVVVILLALVRLAVGPVVLYHAIGRVAWWGLVPLAIYGLRVWRPWIVREYVKRSSRESWLSGVTRRHSQRFYGVLVLALALSIVLVRQVARFVKRNLSDLEATKRLLAFLFRRRVEKHAQEHGRVLETPHELPEHMIGEFPTGPLDPDARPVKPPFLDQIKAAFATWQSDKMEGSVALVGGTGMGKSTALKLLSTALDEPVIFIKLRDKYTRPHELMAALAGRLELPGPAPTTEAEFIDALTRHLAGQDRRVIALDNCHNFFLRKVGGFAAWDAFKRVVNASCDRIFWVMSFNDVAWDYLSNIAGGVAYFRRIVRIPPWTDEDLRRLVLTRMRRAKYRANFTDLVVTRLEGVKTSAQIIRTSQGYFRLLWDFTDGNPRVASHFWLRSLVPDPDKRRVKVHLFAAPRIEELEQLPDDIAFVLAAVVEHENITAEELATVLNMRLEFCRFALQYCREHGYMWRNSRTGRTKLATHWQQSIIRYLKRRHLLYT